MSRCPHACGGEPVTETETGKGENAVPTPVGVNRLPHLLWCVRLCCPHAYGNVPLIKLSPTKYKQKSLRLRRTTYILLFVQFLVMAHQSVAGNGSDRIRRQPHTADHLDGSCNTSDPCQLPIVPLLALVVLTKAALCGRMRRLPPDLGYMYTDIGSRIHCAQRGYIPFDL
jgi:hypothetical protein